MKKCKYCMKRIPDTIDFCSYECFIQYNNNTLLKYLENPLRPVWRKPRGQGVEAKYVRAV